MHGAFGILLLNGDLVPCRNAAPLPASQSSVAQNGSSLFLWNWSLFLFNEWDTYPIGSMYGIFTYIWFIFMVNVAKYTIHGSYGYR